MTNEENGTLQQKKYERQRRDVLNPTVVILIACIVFFVVNGPQSKASNRDRSNGEPTFSDTAILGGVERHSSSQAFRSAEATAFMGGVELDFREAIMEGDEAKIDVTAIMGGVDIRVPRTWTVVNHVTPVMGGVNDHSHAIDSNKRIIIEGTVLMGGLEIKN